MVPIIINLRADQAQVVFYVSMIAVMCVAIFFLIPLALLIFVQTQNFLYNQTTNMRFGKFKRGTVSAND
jgi:hypothetical protein